MRFINFFIITITLTAITSLAFLIFNTTLKGDGSLLAIAYDISEKEMFDRSVPLPQPTAEAASEQAFITLTFDDGWLSQYEHAAPTLNEYNFKASFYIISEATRNAGKRLNGYEKYMRPRQVRMLEKSGHEIGAHTVSHKRLPLLTSGAMKEEIADSKTELLEMGVDSVDTFVYPYGAYNEQTVDIVRQAGFLAARSSNPGFNNKHSDKFLLKTQAITDETTLAEVQAWIDTAVEEKTWLILMFHQIDNDGADYSTTPDFLRGMCEYIQNSNMQVLTLKQGLERNFGTPQAYGHPTKSSNLALSFR